MTAHISLKLFASLAKRTPKDADAYPIPPGTTVRDIVQKLNIDEAEAKLVFVNSRRAMLTTELADGDRVGIFPPVGGG
jgi:molybdopterin converting factor small subunit